MIENKKHHDARHSFLYEKCLPEWWPALDAHVQIRQFKRGSILFKESDTVEGIYFMLKGVVKVHKRWVAEKELIIRFAAENDVLGHRGLSSHSTVYPVTATALSDTRICFIALDFFRTTLRMNPDFAYAFLFYFADELLLSEQRMQDLAHMPVKGRLAKALLSLEAGFGTQEQGFIRFPVSRQDISAYTGAAYETVYKLLLEFTAANMIRTNGRQIAITGRKALEDLF
jgi:CRP-like cAMP-binding protein